MEQITTPAATNTPAADSVVQTVSVYMDGRGVPPVVHLTQYDQTIPVVAVNAWYSGQPYKIPEGAAVNVRMSKPDGKHVYNPAYGLSEDRLTAYIAVTGQMTAAAGEGRCILEVAKPGAIAGTAPFILCIDRNPVPEDAYVSTDEYKTLLELVADAEAARDAAKESEAAAQKSEQGAKEAQGAAEKAQTAAETAQGRAESARTGAEAAQGKAEDAQAGAEAAQRASEAAKDAAKTAQGAAETARDNAKAAQQAAETAKDGAEAAKDSAEAAQKEATKQAGAAADSAADAEAAQQAAEGSAAAAKTAQGAAETARTGAQTAQKAAADSAANASSSQQAAAKSETNAENWSKQSQSWAVGDGYPDRENQAEDNSKEYARQAAESAKLAQSIAQGQKGYYDTAENLKSAHPSGTNGDWAIVGATDTIWVWDSDKSEWTDSGNKTDLSQYYTKTESDGKYAPNTRKVDGYPLTADVNLARLCNVKLTDTDFQAYIDEHAHEFTGEEVKFFRFFSNSKPITETHLPCIDSNIIVWSIDNAKSYYRAVAFDIRSSSVYTICKQSNTWGAWRRIYTEDNKPSASDVGAAAAGHTHNYAGSGTAGGAANSVAHLLKAGSKSYNGSEDITLVAADVGAAAAGHKHNAASELTGVLPVANGGTGNSAVDTAPVDKSTKMVTSGGVFTALAGKAASSHNHDSAYLKPTGDTANNVATFTSGDSTSPTAWADVAAIASGEKHSSLFQKLSTMAKNVRYLFKLLGTTNISSIGGGTVTGAISALNSDKASILSRLTAVEKTANNAMPKSGGEFTGGVVIKGGLTIGAGLELYGGTNKQPYIDLHYGIDGLTNTNDPADYNVRLINDADNKLTALSKSGGRTEII